MDEDRTPLPSVLFADDEPLVRMMVETILTRRGYDCVAVSDGSDALHAEADRRFDVVMLNGLMPRRDGWYVCRKICTRPAHPPVAIHSFVGTRRLIRQSIDAGAACCHQAVHLPRLWEYVALLTASRPSVEQRILYFGPGYSVPQHAMENAIRALRRHWSDPLDGEHLPTLLHMEIQREAAGGLKEILDTMLHDIGPHWPPEKSWLSNFQQYVPQLENILGPGRTMIDTDVEVSISEEGLHCEDGPALHHHADGYALWCLHGVIVPSWLVDTPAGEIRVSCIFELTNTAVRREFVRKVGTERVLRELDAIPIDSRGPYTLLRLDLHSREPVLYLQMENPSTGTWHFEGVPPGCTSVQQALNFRRYGYPHDGANLPNWNPGVLT